MRLAFAAAVLACATAPVLANDTTAELRTGGLVFTKTADVEMRAEDLFVSEKEVRVAYRFFNASAQDVAVTVAFPMPDITIEENGNVSIPLDTSDNFLGFSVLAGGVPVAAALEQHALAGDKDVTEQLKTLGIPAANYLKSTGQALDRLPRVQWDALVAANIAGIEEYDDTGKGLKQHLAPRWTLKSAYHWQQTFPAGKEIEIKHRYRPGVGGTVQTSLAAGGANEAETKKKYCAEASLVTALAKAKAAAKQEYGPPYSEAWLSYVLTTGANWAAPIKDFRLVIDKGEARNLVSFCIGGAKKISATQFEIRRSGFLPKEDLDILILKPFPKQ